MNIHTQSLIKPTIPAVSAVLMPFYGIDVTSGKKPVPLPEHVLRTALKASIKDAQDTAVCMYVCIHVYMQHVCMHVCMYVG